MPQHFVDRLGRSHSVVYVDGYAFGGRPLEGVPVEVAFDPSGALQMQFRAQEQAYLQQFNQAHFLTKGAAYVQDLLGDLAEDGIGQLCADPTFQNFGMRIRRVA